MNTDFEKEAYKQLYNNAIVFLKDGIERLVNKDNGDEDYIDHDLLTLTCSSFQISLELAIKALIIEQAGIRCILNKKQQNLSDAEIKQLFIENNLSTLDFDVQKNFIRSKNYIQDLEKDDFKTIDEFQVYRNRIVHFSYKFYEGDLFDFKYDIIYYLIHIIFKVLLSKKHQHEKPSEFLEYKLGSELHKKLINYKPYVYAMEKLAIVNSHKVFTCIVCNNKTLSQDEDYCYCCNFVTHEFTLINCDYCNEKWSVIYDNLNIKLSNNEAKGLCLNCGEDGIIYECPDCGLAYNIETNYREKCICKE
ncbi:MAG TPA: hypothetical protein DER09_03015 [Prolixibacteraceae bacterium]|nr:hypothetical protein [Prolixibacteraceae bacterium]